MAPAARLGTSPSPGRAASRRAGRTRAALAGVLLTIAVAACGCGAAGGKTIVLELRSANPLTSDLYVRITGPAGAVRYLARGLTAGALGEQAGGAFVPPDVRRRRACALSHRISVLDAPSLQAWRGRKVTLAIYGDEAYAAVYCRGLVAGIYLSRP
jgi:hypothetical protein